MKSALVGVVLGVDATALCLALATTCFSGVLVAGLGLATGLFIFGSFLATIALYRFGGFRQPLAISQDTTISILAPAVVLAASAVAGPMEAKVATGLAVIGVSAVLSGVVFWGVGRLGLGRLVRMFPYPVAAGFLASSGYLLVYTAMLVLTGHGTFTGMVQATADPLVQMRLLPAVVVALTMIVAMRIWAGSMPVLAVVSLALLGFYAALAAFGVTPGTAVELGLLPRVDTRAEGVFSFAMFGIIDWRAVLAAAPVVAAVVLLNLLGMLLNTSGVELATRDDVDENRELRVTGIANLLVGCMGSLTCYLQSGATIMAAKLGVQPKALIVGHGALLLVACVFAPQIVAAVPTFVPAALLMFIGLLMLEDWLINTFWRLTRTDWLIVLCIVLVAASVGILSAIAIGMALAVLMFAYAAIRVPVIRHSTSGVQRRSIRDRNALQGDVLSRDGHRIRILHLQGSLFFGSVEQLITRIREFVKLDPVIQSVIIDFSEVNSFDSSACAALDKLIHVLEAHGIAAHVSGVPSGLLEVFNKWGLPLSTNDATSGPAFRLWPTLDQALEYCETALLTDMDPDEGLNDTAQTVLELGRHHKRCPDLLAKMEVLHLHPGEVLMSAAQTTSDVFIIVSGQLGVHLPATAGPAMRVRSMGAGTIVGEIAYLTGHPRTADVICEEAATVLKLSEASIKRIEAKDRDLAALLMSIFSRSLAAKLAQTNSLVAYSQMLTTQGQG